MSQENTTNIKPPQHADYPHDFSATRDDMVAGQHDAGGQYVLPLSKPSVYIFRMMVFLLLAGLLGIVVYKSVVTAFMANPALNGLIFFVLFLGIILAFRQVFRLFREVKWANSVRAGESLLKHAHPPVLLAPVATLLGDKAGQIVISTVTLRSMLDSIGARLDEARDIGRYLTGLLVFLGLLGTFWGLLDTVSSISKVIASMPTAGDTNLLFDELKSGLAAPLAGMGISFSSSLFGLAGSLVLGFLDLQAGQAQNRFFYELEDWLSASAIDVALNHGEPQHAQALASDTSLNVLADGVQQLVQQMRKEQQLIRNWVEVAAEQQQDTKVLLEALAKRLGTTPERKG